MQLTDCGVGCHDAFVFPHKLSVRGAPLARFFNRIRWGKWSYLHRAARCKLLLTKTTKLHCAFSESFFSQNLHDVLPFGKSRVRFHLTQLFIRTSLPSTVRHSRAKCDHLTLPGCLAIWTEGSKDFYSRGRISHFIIIKPTLTCSHDL